MKSIPTEEECILLLKKEGCSDKVIKHSITVKNLAVKIAKKTNADVKLVEAGALLHDIGRSKTHGIKHIVEGVKIAKKLDLSEKIIKIIERHPGAGIPADEAKKLGLPKKDYIPLSLEEKIICHSDNLIDNGKKRKIEELVEKVLVKDYKEYAIRLVSLHKELSDIVGIDLNKI